MPSQFKFTVKKDITAALKKLDLVASPERLLSRATLTEMGTAAIKEIKSNVERGSSPIKGNGKFPAYKPSYKKAIERGYYREFGKAVEPVNLTLSGKFLQDLRKVTPRSGDASVEVGFATQYGKKLEDGHRRGVKGQRKRPIIPKRGEQFKNPIVRLVKNIALKAIKKGLQK